MEGRFSLMIKYLYLIEGKTDRIENAPVLDWKSASIYAERKSANSIRLTHFPTLQLE